MVVIGLIILLIYMVIVSIYTDFMQPKSTVMVRGTTENIDDLLTQRTASEISRVQEFAILCAASYEVTMDKNVLVDYDYFAKDSEYLNGLWEVVLSDYTSDLREKAKQSNVAGFACQIYRRTRKSEQGKNVFAIVMRGTDGVDDFVANLHWITKLIPGLDDQYDFVRKNAKNMVSTINDSCGTNHDGIEIIASGHSLGGGLAQQLAYAADGIETVYAYAPSPVTGFYDVGNADERAARKKKLRIFRIHERGEILAYLRRIMKLIYPVVQVNPKIVEVRFNFADLAEGSLKAHSIAKLARNLQQAWEKPA